MTDAGAVDFDAKIIELWIPGSHVHQAFAVAEADLQNERGWP